MSMETETIDKLFLELSQFTKAKTAREISLETQLADATRKLEEARKDALEEAAMVCERSAQYYSDNPRVFGGRVDALEDAAKNIRAPIEQGKGGDA
jgi:hypothetical protein